MARSRRARGPVIELDLGKFLAAKGQKIVGEAVKKQNFKWQSEQAAKVLRLSKAFAPVDTGALRAQIKIVPKPNVPKHLIKVGSKKIKYAKAQEFGLVERNIRARNYVMGAVKAAKSGIVAERLDGLEAELRKFGVKKT